MATNRTVITNANNVVSVNDELTQAMATVERLKAEAEAELKRANEAAKAKRDEANAIAEKHAKAFAERKSALKIAASAAIDSFKRDASVEEFRAFLVEFLKELPKAEKTKGTGKRVAVACAKLDANGVACGYMKHTKKQVCKGVAVAA